MPAGAESEGRSYKHGPRNGDEPLEWRAFPAGEHGFFRAPVLLWGASEAVLIDGGFTLSDGHAIVEAIKATGRRLVATYISQSDPDYYFSLGPITSAFPDAAVLAAPETIAAIASSVEKKLVTWSPQLGDNGPRSLADIVMPTAFAGRQLTVDGQQIDIVPATDLINRRYLWVPSLSAIVGGVLIFSGVHVWTADTAGMAARAAWVATLDTMLAHEPTIVVPGHMTPAAPMGRAAIIYTRDYLRAFEEELENKPDSGALIAAMTARYPDAGMAVALQIGAKVATGEMTWG